MLCLCHTIDRSHFPSPGVGSRLLSRDGRDRADGAAQRHGARPRPRARRAPAARRHRVQGAQHVARGLPSLPAGAESQPRCPG